MFILKILFILLLIAFIILLAYTVYNKITNPEKLFMDCIPFMNDFSSPDPKDITPENPFSESGNAALQTISSVEEVTETIGTPKTSANTTSSLSSSSTTSTEKTISSSITKQKKKSATQANTSSKKTKSLHKSKTVKKPKKSKKIGDNIKKINGIGPVFERKLNSIGVNTFEHIAAWSDGDVERIDEQLELSGRPQREEWVAKAKILAAEKKS